MMTAPDSTLCPSVVRNSIDAFVQLGRPTGDFVKAVLSNDLDGAIFRADPINLLMLPHIVAYVRDHVPIGVCGSREAVAAHIESKRAERES
jgi:hypothetical protein